MAIQASDSPRPAPTVCVLCGNSKSLLNLPNVLPLATWHLLLATCCCLLLPLGSAKTGCRLASGLVNKTMRQPQAGTVGTQEGGREERQLSLVSGQDMNASLALP